MEENIEEVNLNPFHGLQDKHTSTLQDIVDEMMGLNTKHTNLILDYSACSCTSK